MSAASAKKRPLYDRLGVSQDASPEEVKRAYRRRAKQTHPDAGGSSDAFSKVHRAFLVLADPQTRAQYDDTGEEPQSSPDNTVARAVELIQRALDQLIAGNADADLARFDLISELRQLFNEAIRNATSHRAAASQREKKFTKLAKRLKCKRGENLLGRVIEARAHAERQRMIAIEQELRNVRAARDLLADYEFKVERPAPTNPYTVASDIGFFAFRPTA